MFNSLFAVAINSKIVDDRCKQIGDQTCLTMLNTSCWSLLHVVHGEVALKSDGRCEIAMNI